MDEVIEAAESANAHDFIVRLPNQYDTHVGERGVQLSGGERQRICVARAFLKNAPILILDEPTSSIDSRTEAVILDALDRLMIGRTTFMIAHRLSTVRNANLILVLDQGELVEQGTEDELLQRDGLYRQLHDVQTRQRPPIARLPEERQIYLLPSPEQEPAHTSGLNRTGGEPGLASAYAIEWLDHSVPSRISASEEFQVWLRLRNSSVLSWPSDVMPEWAEVASTAASPAPTWTRHPVLISYHWVREPDDEMVVWDGVRTALPRDVAPEDEVLVDDVRIVAPEAPGNYRLQVALVHESVTWFENEGASTLTVPVLVTAQGRDGVAPADGEQPEPMLAGPRRGLQS